MPPSSHPVSCDSIIALQTGRFRRHGDQTNADMCFLLLLLAPLSTAGTNITTRIGNFNSHIFTHALLRHSPPIIFSKLSSQSQGVGVRVAGEAFREQQDMHVFSLLEENTIGHTSLPPCVFFLPFLNSKEHF